MKINLNDLRSTCLMRIKHFKKIIPYNSKDKYWFQDNGSKILAVAHLDSVQDCKHFHEMKLPHKHRVYCPVLDDRLGVFIIMHLLPQLKLKYDILLTTDEETGHSTASNFATEKQYNWIFEFDRKGDDVVMYDYETKEMKENLEKIGWKVGSGSYTDISELQFLECKGFNFGTGYEDYHSLDAYVDLKVLSNNIQKFFLFYNKFKDIHLPHKEVEKKSYNFYTHDWRNRYDNYYDGVDDYKCGVCNGVGWKGGTKCPNCQGDGWCYESQKKIESVKLLTIPTASDIYSYSCDECGTYNEINIDACGDEAMEAAEVNMCVKCYRQKIYFI